MAVDIPATKEYNNFMSFSITINFGIRRHAGDNTGALFEFNFIRGVTCLWGEASKFTRHMCHVGTTIEFGKDPFQAV